MKGIYLMLAAVFITLMISPAAYSTESLNLSMGSFKEIESDMTVVYVAANTSTSDEKLAMWDIPVSELTSAECSYGPPGNGTRSPKITEEKKEMLIDLSERWLMENGSREYVKKEFEYHGGRGSMDIFQHECRITCYATSLLDRYNFIMEENTTTKNIRIISVRGPSTRDLTATPSKPYTLGLVGGSFTPTERLDSRIQDKLASAGEDDYTYCFVMLSGRLTGEKRNALTEHGVKVLEPHSQHSYAAKIPLNRIEELGNLSFVRWIGYAPSDLKIHPALKKKISSGSDDEIRVRINVFDSDLNEKSEKIVHGGETQYDGERQYVTKQYYTYITHGPFQNKLEAMGATILVYNDRYMCMTFTVRAAPETINEIADLDFVQSIEPGYPMGELGGICSTEGKMVGSQGSPSIDEPLEPEMNTDEPLEQEEMTTGDSNPEIVTIVRMAFACLQRRLI